MTNNTFRKLCIIAITLMFGLITWIILQNKKENQGVQIKTPWFEYKGEDKKEIRIESPWFEYKGKKP